MKWVVVVLAACSAPDKLDKLGPDDIAEADRVRTPQPGDILPAWEPLFIEGTTWKMERTECFVKYAVPIFGGWRSYVTCNRQTLDGHFVGNLDGLWLTDGEIDDIRKVDDERQLLPVTGGAFERRPQDHDTCFLDPESQGTLCLRPYEGIVGGANHELEWGVKPRSW